MSDQANPDQAVEVAELRARLAEAETTLEAIRLGGGHAPAGAGPYRDQTSTLTQRQQAEEAVNRSQQTFAELVERAPFGIYVVDSQFRIAHMNANSQTGAFRNVRPVIGRDFAEAMRILWPEPVAAEIISHFRHTLETGEPYYSPRFTNPRHDLQTVESYEWELHRLTLPDGQHGVICYYFDSTKLREAEEAARQSEGRAKVAEAVQAEEQRLREVMQMLPGYVILLSPDYHVPFANRFFEERFGKAEGRRCYEYLFNRTEPCENCETFKVLKTNAPHRWEWTGPDGRNYDIHDFPFTDVDGSPLIMEVGLDITERKQAEAELVKHREHLQELVSERTFELRATNKELARFNQAMVGRELRMVELKQEVNALCARLGQPPRYVSEVDDKPKRPAG